LPTSLTYIILSTRGCSPWRPAADMGTIRYEIQIGSLGFSRTQPGARDATETVALYGKQRRYLRLNRFQRVRSLTREENSGSGLARCHRVHLRYRPMRSTSDRKSPYPGTGILTRFPFDCRERRDFPLSVIQDFRQYLRID
jgi:hypothetical protein